MVWMSIHFPKPRNEQMFQDYYFHEHFELCERVPNSHSVVWSNIDTRRMESHFYFTDEDEFVRAVASREGQQVFWDTFKMPLHFFPRFQKIRLEGDIKHPVRFRLKLYGLCVLFLMRWYK